MPGSMQDDLDISTEKTRLHPWWHGTFGLDREKVVNQVISQLIIITVIIKQNNIIGTH